MESNAKAQAADLHPRLVALVHAHHSQHPLGDLPEVVILGLNGVLPADRLRQLENFGHSISTPAYLYRPTRGEQVAELFRHARKGGLHIGLRGAGRSYGDASLNSGGIILDFQRMNRILEWDPESGVIKVEPGVTIEQLWKYTLEDGWWPPIVPGTMYPTIGGCLGSNIHGKNNWKAGTLGEHVLEFTALLPSGREVTCSPKKREELFYAIISGIGILGVFTSITLQMKKIYSGTLNVHAWVEPGLEDMLRAVDASKENDYVVGWVDCMTGKRALGRGQMHTANYPEAGEDPLPNQSLRLDNQVLPDTFFGIVPKSILWRFMQLFTNNPGWRVVNAAKYAANRTVGNHKRYPQSLIAFNFLLDYIPNWELSYGKGGLIQYQSFLPKETARDGYLEMLKLCKRRRLPSYLGVLKRHRPDDFLLSHAVDGYSLALDFRVTDRNRPELLKLTRDLNKIALEAGGRFYFAKDSTLTPEVVQAYLGEETVRRFRKLKTECDPASILQTDLYRRCFLN
jgi:FAD/FMN-containing dehydrogenase